MAAPRKNIDWEKVEAEYRAGRLSLREIGATFGCSDTAVRKKAKREGWKRDLAARIKAKDKKVIIPAIEDDFGREGFIYVIYLDDSADERFYKIGMAKAFTPRFMTHQCASPFDICVACAFFVENMRAEERYLHNRFADNRVRGEWFKLSREDIAEISKRAILT